MFGSGIREEGIAELLDDGSIYDEWFGEVMYARELGDVVASEVQEKTTAREEGRGCWVGFEEVVGC